MESTRILKIAAHPVQRSRRKIKFFSKINLSGKWLHDAGFTIGESVRVIVADGFIQIVKKQTEQLKKEVGNV